MASFYSHNSSGSGTSGGGFYNAAGGGGGGSDHYPRFQQPQQNQQYNSQPIYQQSQQQPQQQQQQQQQQSSSYSSNFNQWQAPSQISSHQANLQHRPQQQQPQNFWNPASSMAMAGLAAQAMSGGMTTQQALENVINIVPGAHNWSSRSFVPGLDATMMTLRAYFAVDNRYVQLKMRRVLFPFLAKQWHRMVEGPEMVNYALPNSDENAPDLYLPVMSLITYCLLCALTYGTSGKFNPEVIADVTTKCFITQVLEVLLIRFGFYMMQAPVPLLDLFSYTGYKYLGLTCNMLFGLLLGQLGYGTSGFYVTFLWTASAATFFMLKTMANNIPTQTASTGPKREFMVLAFALSQALSMWFVSQTQFL